MNAKCHQVLPKPSHTNGEASYSYYMKSFAVTRSSSWCIHMAD